MMVRLYTLASNDKYIGIYKMKKEFGTQMMSFPNVS